MWILSIIILILLVCFYLKLKHKVHKEVVMWIGVAYYNYGVNVYYNKSLLFTIIHCILGLICAVFIGLLQESSENTSDKLKNEKNLNVATVLAFIGGRVGAHELYLGNRGKAAAYIVLSRTYIPYVLGIIDGFYLLKDSLKKYLNLYNEKEKDNKIVSNEYSIQIPENIPNAQDERYIYNYFEDTDYETKQYADKNVWYIYKKGNEQPISVLKQISIDESQILLLLKEYRHNNIVEIYKVGKMQGTRLLYVEMEYVAGKTLGKWIEHFSVVRDSKTFTLKETLHVAIQICKGLQFFHNLGFNHRDLSRNNVILNFNDIKKSIEVKIIDFGNFHKIDPDTGNDTTSLGTMGYAAPEQYGGKTDQTTDIFALGRLMCEMLTGDSTDFKDATQKIKNSTMRYIVIRCSRMDKDERFPHIAAVVSELQKLYDDIVDEENYSSNKFNIINKYIVWYNRNCRMSVNNVMLEDFKPISTPLDIVLLCTVLCLISGLLIDINIIAWIIILGIIPYNFIVGGAFCMHLECMQFVYPYSLNLLQMKDKLKTAMIICGYKCNIIDENNVIISITRRRKYMVTINIEDNTMKITNENKLRCNIHNVYKRAKDYGKLVYIIQHMINF